MSPREQALLRRRAFLGQAGRGLGAVALASLLGPSLLRGGANPPRFPARARRVIYLYMAGGPSQLETFDYKPKLAALDGKPMPESLTRGQQLAQLQMSKLNCLAPQYPFRKCGASGQEVSSILPHIGSVADELCIIRSAVTDAINHDPAHTFLNTGSTIPGRPSMGSWAVYGLGSECANLPGFVVLTSTGPGGEGEPLAARLWHSGFLPSRFQGVPLRGRGDPVLYLGRPAGVTAEQQREVVEAVRRLDRRRGAAVDDPEVATRVAQYEMAFRMQASVPGLTDVSDEPASVLEMYGTRGGDGTFAANCLLARRLAERGVRFIQVYHRGWDHHLAIKDNIKKKAEEVDRPTAALLKDLKRRGLLEDTLVV
jgi:hypothetical protein